MNGQSVYCILLKMSILGFTIIRMNDQNWNINLLHHSRYLSLFFLKTGSEIESRVITLVTMLSPQSNIITSNKVINIQELHYQGFLLVTIIRESKWPLHLNKNVWNYKHHTKKVLPKYFLFIFVYIKINK